MSPELKRQIIEEFNVPPSGLVRKRAIARYLGLSPRTIDKLVADRVIPYVRMNGQFHLFNVEAVKRAIANMTVKEVSSK
jgi:excisionase family DNA binding protein